MQQSRLNIAYLTIIGLNILFVLLVEGKWFLSGQMFAEMATNYYPTALDPNWLHKFFATDAGYIPLPQRLIAAFVALLHLPAVAIPYAYNFFAIILTGALVAPFCLPRFRVFIESDAARFLACLFLLLVCDFETRTFINFTYFSIPFLFCVALTAFDRTVQRLPWWAWFAPVLLLSKPAVVSALPILLLATIFNLRKCWKLAFVCVLAVVIQIIRLKLSAQGGMAPEFQGDFTLWEKLHATVMYFLGTLGGYTLGPVFSTLIVNKTKIYILFGSVLFALSFMLFFFINREKKFLLVASLSLIFLNILLNCFSLSLEWNQDLARLDAVPNNWIYRHAIGISFGVVFFVLTWTQIFAMYISKFMQKISKEYLCMVFFLAWAIGGGWVKAGYNISHLPSFPFLGSSNWHELSDKIDSPHTSLCVFLDPYPWIYSKNCHIIGTNSTFDKKEEWTSLTFFHPIVYKKANFPQLKENSTLISSLAVIARPPANHIQTLVNIQADATTDTGQMLHYVGQKRLSRSGGVIQLLPSSDTKVILKDISEIKLYTNTSIDIFSHSKETMPIIFLGN